MERLTYPVLSLVDVFGETLTFIVEVPEFPDVGETSIQLADEDAVHEASALMVTLTELAVLLNTSDSVDAFIEAGTCLTVMFFDALVVPEWITETVAVRFELDSLLVTVNVIVLSFWCFFLFNFTIILQFVYSLLFLL